MDIVDRAQEIEEMDRANMLARHFASRLTPDASCFSALYCQNIYCGVEIPEERRRAVPGVQLCVECQKLKERGARGHVTGIAGRLREARQDPAVGDDQSTGASKGLLRCGT